MPSELQSGIERWSASLAAPLALFDVHDELVVHSSHHGEVDDVRRESILTRTPVAEIRALMPSLRLAERHAPFPAPVPDGLQMLPRVVVPLHSAGRFLGSVWISDPERTLVHDPRLAEAATELAGLLDFHQRPTARTELTRRHRAAATLRGLLGEGGRGDEAWQELGTTTGRTGAETTLVVAHPTTPALTAGVVARSHGRDGVLLLEDAAHTAVWAVLSDGAQTPELVHGALDIMSSGQAGPPLGASAPVAWGGDLRPALREARDAARAAATFTELRGIAHWPRLGVVGAALLLERATPRFWESFEALRGLAAVPAPLRRTAETFLDLAGDASATARVLATHRATIYYRWGRLEALLGHPLRDGDLRTSLHLALKALRLQEAAPPPVA